MFKLSQKGIKIKINKYFFFFDWWLSQSEDKNAIICWIIKYCDNCSPRHASTLVYNLHESVFYPLSMHNEKQFLLNNKISSLPKKNFWMYVMLFEKYYLSLLISYRIYFNCKEKFILFIIIITHPLNYKSSINI